MMPSQYIAFVQFLILAPDQTPSKPRPMGIPLATTESFLSA